MMNSQKGQALPLALVALAIGMLTIAPFLSHAGSSLIGSRIYQQSTSEQYSADAGVEYAIWHLQSGESEVPEGEELELPQFMLNSQSVNVTIDNQGEQIYKITSIATSDDGSSTTIEAYVSIILGFFDGSFTTFPGGLTLNRGEEYTGNVYAEGNIQLDQNATINGNVYAEGNIQLDQNATINGNVYAEGSIQLDRNATINGDVCAGGNVQLDQDAVINGNVYAVGNVHLDKNAAIDGDVYAGGDVQLGQGATITGDYPLPYEGCPLQGIRGIDIGIDIQTWEIGRQ